MALHWALNTRFWTNSKDLQLPPNRKKSLGLYEFYISVYEFEIATILEELEGQFGISVLFTKRHCFTRALHVKGQFHM